MKSGCSEFVAQTPMPNRFGSVGRGRACIYMSYRDGISPYGPACLISSAGCNSARFDGAREPNEKFCAPFPPACPLVANGLKLLWSNSAPSASVALNVGPIPFPDAPPNPPIPPEEEPDPPFPLFCAC